MLPTLTLADLQAVAAVLLASTLLSVVYHRLRAPRPLPLPPGPPGHWLFGNTLPTAFAYRKFEQWTQEYGPVFTLRQGTHITVVVGRQAAAADILEKEGAATVDRPPSISAGETLSGGMRMLLTPAGERFKKMRRALHAQMQPKAAATYGRVQMQCARTHILDILDDPARHQEHAKRFSASVVMALAYGKRPRSADDPDIVSVNRCLTRLGLNLRPGLWKVDVYPFLRYIPGYLRELQLGHQEELALFKRQLQDVRDQMAANTAPPSFGRYLLERQAELGLDDAEIAYLAGSMFGAGSDTTASAISVTVMAAAVFPAAQARVQAELDAVVGRSRPPTFADMDALPQTMAFVLESFRWRPVSAGGFAHRAMKDIIWQGYRIPRGAAIIGNTWSTGRDPAVFADPEAFAPQRWVDGAGRVRDDVRSYNWGFGRRVCPGQHIATRSVFINCALLLWAFGIAADPAAPIDTLAFTESANTHPLPFKVVFAPRVADWEGTRELLDGYGD